MVAVQASEARIIEVVRGTEKNIPSAEGQPVQLHVKRTSCEEEGPYKGPRELYKSLIVVGFAHLCLWGSIYSLAGDVDGGSETVVIFAPMLLIGLFACVAGMLWYARVVSPEHERLTVRNCLLAAALTDVVLTGVYLLIVFNSHYDTHAPFTKHDFDYRDKKRTLFCALLGIHIALSWLSFGYMGYIGIKKAEEEITVLTVIQVGELREAAVCPSQQ